MISDRADAAAGREAIAQTLYRYAFALDELDADLLASCFTEDAVLSTSGGAHATGRRRICEYFLERQLRRRAGGEQPRHVITNIAVLELGERRAVVKPYVLNVVSVDGGAPTPQQVGWYRDTFVKPSDVWLIHEHYIHSDTRESSSERSAPQASPSFPQQKRSQK